MRLEIDCRSKFARHDKSAGITLHLIDVTPILLRAPRHGDGDDRMRCGGFRVR